MATLSFILAVGLLARCAPMIEDALDLWLLPPEDGEE
jgi:hypothetical protein